MTRSSQIPKLDISSTILAITSEPPWPLDSGGHLRTFHLLNSLTAHANVHLMCPLPESSASLNRVPESAAFNYDCVTVPDRSISTEVRRVLSAQLASEPYSMFRRHDWRVLRNRWAQKISEIQPQFLWLDQIDSFQYIQHTARPDYKTVLDMHNIYSLILSRLADETSNTLKRAVLKIEAERMAKIEEKACRSVDAVLAVSEQEVAHFKKLGAKNVWIAPNGVHSRTGRVPRSHPVNLETPVVLFLGAMNWPPNVSAAIYLARALFPLVKTRFPGTQLKLVGKDPVASVRELEKLEGVTVTGTVPDIEPYLAEATVMVVPLESGGGTRLKILESFAAGLPVVSTPVGAEGIDAENGVHLLISELDGFPEAISTVFENVLERSMIDNAANLVKDKYDWAAIAESTASFLHQLQLPVHSNHQGKRDGY